MEINHAKLTEQALRDTIDYQEKMIVQLRRELKQAHDECGYELHTPDDGAYPTDEAYCWVKDKRGLVEICQYFQDLSDKPVWISYDGTATYKFDYFVCWAEIPRPE